MHILTLKRLQKYKWASPISTVILSQEEFKIFQHEYAVDGDGSAAIEGEKLIVATNFSDEKLEELSCR